MYNCSYTRIPIIIPDLSTKIMKPGTRTKEREKLDYLSIGETLFLFYLNTTDTIRGNTDRRHLSQLRDMNLFTVLP